MDIGSDSIGYNMYIIRNDTIGYITAIRSDPLCYITDIRSDTVGYMTDIIRNDNVGYLTAIRICLNTKKYLFLSINVFRYKVRVRRVSASVCFHLPVRYYSSGFCLGPYLKYCIRWITSGFDVGT